MAQDKWRYDIVPKWMHPVFNPADNSHKVTICHWQRSRVIEFDSRCDQAAAITTCEFIHADLVWEHNYHYSVLSAVTARLKS